MGNDMLFINGSFPRAIVHIDGDAFSPRLNNQ